jgi:hypothetical protein
MRTLTGIAPVLDARNGGVRARPPADGRAD